MIWSVVAIALSAFLLFLVQPLFARQILPWFGGSAAVWSTCLAFFQLTLLGGYFYADWTSRRLSARGQALLHTSLLVSSLLTLPLAPNPALRSTDPGQPVGRMLAVLVLGVGLPYFMLSTTGPLVQSWFSLRFHNARVYRLYALSNLMSMLALIAYPSLLEPLTSTRTQSWLWSGLYLAFAASAVAVAWSHVRHARGEHQPIAAQSAETPQADPVGDQDTGGEQSTPGSPSWWVQTRWLVLAGLGSLLLAGLTAHLTQNIASIPLLWVVPLALYLLSFVLCFDGSGWYWRRFYPAAAVLVAVAMILGLSWKLTGSALQPQRGVLHLNFAVALYTLGFGVLCMFLQGELALSKPEPRFLTRFYLMLSAGGALGGASVALLAPLVLDAYWEVPLALTATAGAVALLAHWPWQRALGVTGAIVCLCLSIDYGIHIRGDVIDMQRNFYGVLRVKAAGPSGDPRALMRLVHGSILHGEQRNSPQESRLPGTYYSATSGVGRAIEGLRTANPGRPQRVGLIGLGVGTLTAYARTGDQYLLYELNPAVLEIAQRHFTYLSDCQGVWRPVLGDARLSLEAESPRGFDVLAVDAFSSDSIPVHLLTAEALTLYQRHMRPDGIIAFHISNRYLDLAPVLRDLADRAGLLALQVKDDPPKGVHASRSDWVLMGGRGGLLAGLMSQGVGSEASRRAGLSTWHDDRYNLVQILK